MTILIVYDYIFSASIKNFHGESFAFFLKHKSIERSIQLGRMKKIEEILSKSESEFVTINYICNLVVASPFSRKLGKTSLSSLGKIDFFNLGITDKKIPEKHIGEMEKIKLIIT